MNVNKWGPGGWIFLHTITFNYPEKPTNQDKKKYINFFNSIGDVLPCKYCRDSYNIYIKHIPIKYFIDSREGITYWLYNIHNLVNNKIFKDEHITFLEVVKKYESFRATCKKKKEKKKSYNSCKMPAKKKNKNKLIKFVDKAELKYKPIIKKLLLNLFKCKNNPNKVSLKNK